MERRELVRHLNFYETAGFSIVPVPYGSKAPIIPWTAYQDRRATQSEKEAWFGQGTMTNLAVVCGPISDVFVWDFDDEDTYRLFCSASDSFMNTLVARTGNGYHCYFRPDGEMPSTIPFKKNGKMHHVRAHGAIVIAPPSTHPTGKSYAFNTLCEPAAMSKEEVEGFLTTSGSVFAPKENGYVTKPTGWAAELFDLGNKIKEHQGRNVAAASLCGLLRRKFNDPGVIMGIMYAWNEIYCDPPLESKELKKVVDGELSRYGYGEQASR